MAELRLNIDGYEVTGQPGQTILQVATENGIHIPTMCYDERVKIYGSCGLCVVEAEGMPKLMRACATEIAGGMVIKTQTKRVRESRKTALELLLSDHTGDCRPPCVLACPGETDCQGYVGLIANGEFEEATKLIKEQLPLPASIGRVCPHPCETACRRQLVEDPINIAMLKSFTADYDLKQGAYVPEIAPANGKKVAIIGGGPGGLTAAYYLRKGGTEVTVYDMMPKMGGMLRYGIPEYRLPKRVVDSEVAVFEQMGIVLKNNVKIGRDISFDTLRTQNDAVLLAIGAWSSMKMGVTGEEIEGVVGGIDFLRKVSLNEPILTGKRIAVVGGGNTAMDCARTAVRLGAEEVSVIYRRTRAEMPAEDIEIDEAEEEGVNFKFLTNPLEFIADDKGHLAKVRLQKMQLGEPDASGRRSPVPIPGEEEVLEVDTLCMAIGQIVNPEGFGEVSLTKRKTIAADEACFTTNLEGVFAFGDATNRGAGIAIAAIGEAKKAAAAVLSYMEGAIVPYRADFVVTQENLTKDDFADREKHHRVKIKHLKPEYRKTNFNEVNTMYTAEEAMKEASRCLECGCHDFFECKLISLANEYDVQPEKLAGEVHKRQTPDSHPFIVRNEDKCILCGLCVRVCDEVMGVTALGLVDRGFDTIVKPSMDEPLEKTDCISCGQCVSMCPTGALGERLPVAKNVPLKTSCTETACSFCSVGCTTTMESKGNMLLRSTFKDTEKEKGFLCVNGKFGFGELSEKRLTKPMVKKDGHFEEVDLYEALMFITKKAQSVAVKEGADAVAVGISDRLTNEEVYLCKKYAQEVLETQNIVCFNSNKSGVASVVGIDASGNTFDELENTDVIFLAYSDVMKDHAVAGVKIRRAVEKGAKLVILNDTETLADEWAAVTEQSGNSVDKLAEFAKALVDLGAKPANANGFEAFADSLADVKPSDAVKQMAELYKNAKRAMIVFDGYRLSDKATTLLAEIAVMSGHIGSPRNGFIQILQNCNSAGVRNMNVLPKGDKIRRDVSAGKVKALICFGEEVPHLDTASLELLAVFDTSMTETAEMADVVIPLASFAESQGTYLSADRKIQKVNRVIPALAGMENWELISALMNVASKQVDYKSVEDIQDEVSRTVSGFNGYHKGCSCDSKNKYYPMGKNPVLFGDGFMTESGKAEFTAYKDGKAFVDSTNTNAVFHQFQLRLKKEGIMK